MEIFSARGAFQPGLKILARFDQTGLGEKQEIWLPDFIFGAKTNISARAEVHHVIATKFQPG